MWENSALTSSTLSTTGNLRPDLARTLWDTSPSSIRITSRHMKSSALNAWFWVEADTRLWTAR